MGMGEGVKGWFGLGSGGGVLEPFLSTIVLFNNRSLFPQGFGVFSGRKDPWKEWGSYPRQLFAMDPTCSRTLTENNEAARLCD